MESESMVVQNVPHGRKGAVEKRKTGLNPGKQKLVRMMQRLNFGRIERLLVVGGEPVFEPPPRMIREVKFGGIHGPRPEASLCDFGLKVEVSDLFELLSRLDRTTVHCIEVRHGLPFRMTLEEPAA